MRELLAGLTICLIASLLLVAVADGAGRGYLHLSAPLSLTGGRLWNRKWASATIWSDRVSWFRIHAGEAGWEFAFDKWQWTNTHRQLRRVRLDSGGEFLCQGAPILTSVSIGFQGPVTSREQCAHLGSFVPRTS
jgi:hypothetical protein